MQDLMIVETRDPTGRGDVDWMADLAIAVHGRGVTTSIFLTENGVLGARRGAACAVRDWIKAGVRVSADSFALQERGISDSQLVPGVAPAGLETVLDGLIAGASVVWR